MKNKDQIEIRITTKDKIYLCVIMLLIITVVLVFVYVPRYYKLKFSGSSATSSNNGSSSIQNPSSENTFECDIPIEDLKNCYTTKVLVLLCKNGNMFSSMKNYLTKDNYLDANLLKLTTAKYSKLEELAEPIFNKINSLPNNSPTEDDILLDDELTSSIAIFKNTLDNLQAEASIK